MILAETLLQRLEEQLRPDWAQLDQTCHQNTERILEAFLQNDLNEIHFTSVTGYGHHDLGRAGTDHIFAHAFQAEAALVRLQFVSGTHAIITALQACLSHQKGLLLSLTGRPYDTLESFLGVGHQSRISLKALDIPYLEMDLLSEGGLRLDFSEAERQQIKEAEVFYIQRSRGYSIRASLSLGDLLALFQVIRAINPTGLIFVDNCYGEFVGTQEPTAIGADLIAGSLIKNPGGGIVPTGGYIAGKAALVETAAEVLTAPGIGSKGGYTFDLTRTLLQGLYFAPLVVKEALKGMSLAAAVFQELGYDVNPKPFAPQADIIQVIRLGSADKVLSFCKTIQSMSPVGAKYTPVPEVTPGYTDPVVMAGGTFIFGSTIELSVDAPMRPPFDVFLQGGLSYSHVRVVLKRLIENFSMNPEQALLSMSSQSKNP